MGLLINLPAALARLQRSSRDRLTHLKDEVERLAPDGAILIAVEGLSESDVNLRREIISLSHYLRSRLIGLGVSMIEDYEKAGVWVYKRPESHGKGVAIGPQKEAEIRNRPISM